MINHHTSQPYTHEEAETALVQAREQRDEVNRELDALKEQLRQYPKAPRVLKAMVAKDVADEAAEIASQIRLGQLSGEEGKTALYALQVALSAIKTIDQAASTRQREERLRSTQKSATAPSVSPKGFAATASKKASRNPSSNPPSKRATVNRTPSSTSVSPKPFVGKPRNSSVRRKSLPSK
jgi:hypothetical protein